MYNLQKILSKEDIENGFKKLKKKKKCLQNLKGAFVRFGQDSAFNNFNSLGKFIQNKSTDKKLTCFYNGLRQYKLDSYQALAIRKGRTNKYRPLLIPSPKDRLVFDAILPKYKKALSVALTKRKLLGLGLIGVDKGISVITENIFQKYISNGYEYVLILDYSSFFSEIDRGILFTKLTSVLSVELSDFLKVILDNKIDNVKSVEKKTGVLLSGRGVPQGLSFAPFLACYYALDIDDIYRTSSTVKGFRYIDDVILLAKSKCHLESIYKEIVRMSEKLGMKLHKLGTQGKTELKDLSKETIIFLGVEIDLQGLSIPNDTFSSFEGVIRNELLSKKIIAKRDSTEIRRVYENYVTGWLNHYRDIYKDNGELYERLDNIILKYMKKDRNGCLKFFYENQWLIISKNNKFLDGNKVRVVREECSDDVECDIQDVIDSCPTEAISIVEE